MSDAAELEREAEAARARLSDTADQIRARMSPGQMMDEVLNQFRGGDGSQMLANLRDQARDNPMALALVGSGLAWLMMGSGSHAAWRVVGRRVDAAENDGPVLSGHGHGEFRPIPVGGIVAIRHRGWRVRAASWGGSARSAVGSAVGSATDMARGASDALASAGTAVGEGLHEAGDRTRRMAHDLRDAGSDAIGGVRHAATGVGHQARDTFFDVLEREPLVIGAIGLAVGAAIGAFLPATTMEREHLGSTGEALKEKAEALADRGMAKAKEAVAEVYETARDAADREGLLPGDKPVAEKVDAVVRAVGETVGGIAERNTRRSRPTRGLGRGPTTAKGSRAVSKCRGARFGRASRAWLRSVPFPEPRGRRTHGSTLPDTRGEPRVVPPIVPPDDRHSLNS